jgi:predicted 3-demethylubiquinone-9 3-methyltransferase (glyoxalase superfamily)
MQNVSTCLWFDGRAEEAVGFYIGIFPDSRILDVLHYLDGAPRPAGSVLTIRFTLDGVEHVALDGGPQFGFSPAVSLVAYCDTQQELDRLWDALCDGGQPGQCGWLTDRFGVSWQIVPRPLLAMLGGPDRDGAQRAFAAMMTMGRLDIATLRRAHAQA